MRSPFKTLKRHSKRILSDENGSITVESVLWMPIYLLFFTLIADVSLMFHSQAQATRIVHDTNRLASTGTYTTSAQMEAAVRERLNDYSPNATINSTFGPSTVLTTVSMPVSDVAAIGILGTFTRANITVSLIHLVEA